jgi:hypothetical protein
VQKLNFEEVRRISGGRCSCYCVGGFVTAKPVYFAFRKDPDACRAACGASGLQMKSCD